MISNSTSYVASASSTTAAISTALTSTVQESTFVASSMVEESLMTTAAPKTSSRIFVQDENVSVILASLPTSDFSISDLSPVTIALLLNSQLDLADCIVNCSNNGQCKVSNNQIVCACDTGYAGKSCQASSKPCEYRPCLHNATCIDSSLANETSIDNSSGSSSSSSGYSCECQEPYYGVNCEYKVNICLNKTCSSNGYCKEVNASTAQCQCFSGYSGDECQTASTEKKAIQTVISTASVIAIAAMGALFVFTVSIDVANVALNHKKNNMKLLKLKKLKKPIIFKPAYKA
jgi:hypothetical protein